MHEVLVDRLGGLSLPRKSVVRLTDRPDMTLDVYRGRKTTMQQQQKIYLIYLGMECLVLIFIFFLFGKGGKRYKNSMICVAANLSQPLILTKFLKSGMGTLKGGLTSPVSSVSGAPYRGYGYVPMRFGGNVVRRMETQQQQPVAFCLLSS